MKGHRLTPGDNYRSRRPIRMNYEKKWSAATRPLEEKKEIGQTKKIGRWGERFQLAARQTNSSEKRPCTRLSLYLNFSTSWNKLTTHLRRFHEVRSKEKNGLWTWANSRITQGGYEKILLQYLREIIIIIMSCRQHGYPRPSLVIPLNRSSLLAGPQGYIPYPHRATVCRFELVALLLYMRGSIRVHHLWVLPCFSNSVLRVWFV